MPTPASPGSGKRFRIGQVAKILGVEAYVLRFWEEEFPSLTAARTPKGQRYYTEEHVRLLKRIRHLLHDEKLTIKGARRKLENPAGDMASLDMIRAELEEIRRLLMEKP